MLHAWGQPSHVTRCGLFHSIYSGQLFHFKLFNLFDASHRATLQNLVGADAEHLMYEFAASDRQPSLPLVHGRQDPGPPGRAAAPPPHQRRCAGGSPHHPPPAPAPHAHASESLRERLQHALPFSSHAGGNGDGDGGPPVVRFGVPLDPRGYTFAHRGLPGVARHVSAKTLAEVLLVTVADVAEQLTGVSTFIDIYQKDANGQPGRSPPGDRGKLWPGNGQPGLGHAFFSNVLFLAAPYLDVVPPVYHGCTTIVREDDEVAARDAYWRVVTEEPFGLAPREQARLLQLAVRKNPFVAEPHVLLAQLRLNAGAPHAAAQHASDALALLYAWGTCWDKRRGWAQWVGFARVLHLQAHRQARGAAALPWLPLAHADPASQAQCDLGDLVAGFDDVTEPRTAGNDAGAVA